MPRYATTNHPSGTLPEGGTATERPKIPEAELAARYAVNATYERAALLLKHHPEVAVYPGLAAMVPVYAEWRAAAAAVLARTPGARHETSNARGDSVRRPIAAPPSEAETDALRTTIAESVARWREVQSTDAAVLDTDALRTAFGVAAWSGDWPALIGSWRTWMDAIVADHNLDGERAALKVALCIRTGPLPVFRRWEPGTPLPIDLPQFGAELDRALRAVPPAPTGKGR